MKMYANYILERLGRDTIVIPDIGFATFEIDGDECYLVDIFVEKKYRKDGFGKVMADQICKIAKRKGCTVLKGFVQTDANNSDVSEKVLLAYGMTLFAEVADQNLKIFKKEI